MPKELRSKFDNNSHPDIFLGYCDHTSTYKILDVINNKIIQSRTVEFMENEPGNSFLNRIHSNNKFRESNCLNRLRYSNEINDYNNKITDIINERNITTNIN